MRLTPWTTLSLAVVGDDLFAAVVSRGLRGASSWRGPVLRGFLSMPADEARRALAGLMTTAGAPAAAARVLLTVPTSWCAVRPVPVDARGWGGAREGLLASIEQLAPVSASDAMVGLVSRRGPQGGAPEDTSGHPGGDDAALSSGYLVVARRSQVGAWTQGVARALGREVSAVLGAPMAILGLGLQNADRAEVLDELAGGVLVRHALVGGEVDELAATLGFADAPSPGAVRLPGVSEDSGGTGLTGHEVAVAAALAEDLGAGQFVPLDGAPRRAPRRWVLPAAACVGAGLLWIAGLRVSEARYEHAIDALASQRQAVAEQQREVERTRARVLRLAALVNQGVNPIARSWTPALPHIASAQGAVDQDGFVYWIRWNAADPAAPASIEMRGEAPKTARVLAALEAPSSLFTNARLVDPVSTVAQRGLETFTVRAERKPPAGPPPVHTGGTP